MKDGKWIRMKPLDVLFFRDALPFGAGEAHRARTRFPPLPTTVQGAIRTAALATRLSELDLSFQDYNNYNDDKLVGSTQTGELEGLQKALGDTESYGQLQLRGPFLFASLKQGEPPTLWFPRPMDVLVERKTKALYLLQPSPDAFPGAQWNAPAPLGAGFPTPLMVIGEQPEEPKFRYLDVNALIQYLNGEIRSPVDEEAQKAALDFTEHRFGIQLDRERRTVAPGMLYTAEVIRLKADDALLLAVECPHFPPQGILRLGGEARAVRYETVDLSEKSPAFHSLIEGDARKELKEKVANGRFKLYLLTPAIFRNGWLPDFINPKTGELASNAYPAFQGFKFRLVSAAVGKPVHIGGWDLARNAPRLMFKAVPPGSVYYFELTEGDTIESLFDALHFRPLVSEAPHGEELAKVGLGLALVGTWDYLEGGSGV